MNASIESDVIWHVKYNPELSCDVDALGGFLRL